MDMKMNNIDAFNRFYKLVEKYKKSKREIHLANEATTRLLIIDEILTILGWEKDSFCPEEHMRAAGYCDYKLTSNGISRLIVEAKRTGETFRSSLQNFKKSEYEVRYFKRAFKSSFSEVIDQARKYCLESHVPYGVITNGVEWVVLQLIPPPGVNLDSAKGIYFGNIFSENFEFDLLWNLLSFESVEQGALEEHLSHINYQSAEYCKILKSDYNSLLWKSSSDELYLSAFYESFFSQITESDKRHMLEHCFVSNSKLDQYRGDLKRILKDTKPMFLPIDAEDFDPGESKELILGNQNTGNVVIITGSVGCGKSTLVTKCMVESRQSGGEISKPILIDLIHEVGNSSANPREVVFNLIYEYLQDRFSELFTYEYLKKIFHNELKILKDGEHKMLYQEDKALYLKHEADLMSKEKDSKDSFVLKALRCLTRENISIILVIDNVDRAHEKFQEEVYALSHKISSFTGVKTIITLREFTFFKNKKSGFLDVRPEDKVIHLKAPDFIKLISKRIRYIETQLDNDFRVRKWRKTYTDLGEFLSMMKIHAQNIKNNMLKTKEGHTIIETLSSISWHNIRYFYTLLQRVHRQLGGASGGWNNDSVIAGLMASTEVGEKPTLPNIFVPYKNIEQSYYLKPRIMAFLSILKSGEISNGVPFNRIMTVMRLYGYQSSWIQESITRCVRQRLIECLEIPAEEDATVEFNSSGEGTYRISPLGLLYLDHIIKNETYLSLISIDLPIHSSSYFEKLKDEFENLNSYMSDDKQSVMFQEGLDLLLESQLSNIANDYLANQLSKEKITTDNFLSLSEVQLTERKIKESLHGHISKETKVIPVGPKNNDRQFNIDFTLEDGKPKKQEFDHRDVISKLDYDFDSPDYIGSEYVPLIFCALKLKLHEGQHYCSGAEICSVINEYLVSDNNKKFPNNVSRALRSEALLEQEWLTFRADMHPRNKYFGLKDGWEKHWNTVFNL